MRKFCGGDIIRLGAMRLYIAIDNLKKKKKVDLNKLFISDEWSQHKLSSTKIGQEVKKLLLYHSYWDKVAKVVSLYEPLYMVLQLVDS